MARGRPSGEAAERGARDVDCAGGEARRQAEDAAGKAHGDWGGGQLEIDRALIASQQGSGLGRGEHDFNGLAVPGEGAVDGDGLVQTGEGEEDGDMIDGLGRAGAKVTVGDAPGFDADIVQADRRARGGGFRGAVRCGRDGGGPVELPVGAAVLADFEVDFSAAQHEARDIDAPREQRDKAKVEAEGFDLHHLGNARPGRIGEGDRLGSHAWGGQQPQADRAGDAQVPPGGGAHDIGDAGANDIAGHQHGADEHGEDEQGDEGAERDE